MENGACLEQNNDLANDAISNVQHPSVFDSELSENKRKRFNGRTFKKNLTEKNEENSKSNNELDNYKNSPSHASLDENKTVFEP